MKSIRIRKRIIGISALILAVLAANIPVMTFAAAPSVTGAVLTGGTETVEYTGATLTASGDEPIIWEITSGSLPDGLSLDSSTGVISGTPSSTSARTYEFTARASNGEGSATADFSITIAAAEAPTITTTSPLADGVVGGVYGSTTGLTLSADGTGTITWSLAGSSDVLPDGLSLSSDGTISGEPTTAGTYTFTVRATNAKGDTEKEFEITVNEAPTITTSTISDGTVAMPYSQTLAADGTTPITWLVESGSLPDGLSMDSDGTISGTPTSTGTFSFTARAKNMQGWDTKALSITVNTNPYVTTESLPDGTVTVAYSATLEAGGTPNFTWSVASGSSLPDGLNLSNTGVISGTPTTAGTYEVEFTVTNGDGDTANATFTFEIVKDPEITTASLADGILGASYSETLAADGTTPITWSITSGSLPDGLSLNTSTGEISGTPTATGTYTFTAEARNSITSDSAALTITVEEAPEITTTSPLPDGAVGTSYSQTLAADGTTPIIWSVTSGALPGGLALDASTGVISGTPTMPGIYMFIIRAENDAGSDMETFTITIDQAPRITTTSLPGGTVGTSYSETLAASGSAPITWAVVSGTLPPGLSLNASTGAISGTPTTAGTYTFVVAASNSSPISDTREFTITIGATGSSTSGSSASSGTSASSGSSGSSSGASASSGTSSSGTGASSSSASSGSSSGSSGSSSHRGSSGTGTGGYVYQQGGGPGNNPPPPPNGAGAAPGSTSSLSNAKDMPKTGDVGVYQKLLAVALFLFGAFEIVTSLTTTRTVRVRVRRRK